MKIGHWVNYDLIRVDYPGRTFLPGKFLYKYVKRKDRKRFSYVLSIQTPVYPRFG